MYMVFAFISNHLDFLLTVLFLALKVLHPGKSLHLGQTRTVGHSSEADEEMSHGWHPMWIKFACSG